MDKLIYSLLKQVIAPLVGTLLVTPGPYFCTSDLMGKIASEQIGETGTEALNHKESRDGYALNSHHFEEVVDLHDEWKPRLTEARQLLTTHATELAQLVKSLPGTDAWSESSIRDHIQNWKKWTNQVSGEFVFEPWTSRWNGVWSNGRPQYHIWDKTRRWGQQWVQVVAQSEYVFPEEPSLVRLIQEQKADLGINVFSEEYGVTGWVSKRQHGRLEIPCLGYVIDHVNLLWVCLIGDTSNFELEQWFVYLETVERTAEGHHYIITGHPFEIRDSVVWNKNLRIAHTGRYTAD